LPKKFKSFFWLVLFQLQPMRSIKLIAVLAAVVAASDSGAALTFKTDFP
jgi:hypothetical protein